MADPKQTTYGEIKVIGVGLGRTGTGSTMMALNKLGYKTFHMKEVRTNLKHFSIKWPEIYKKVEAGTITRADWDDVFGDYTATLDFPAAMFPRELYAVYPNAKYILTVRDDAKKWHASTMSTVAKTNEFPFWHLTYLLRPPWAGLLKITDYFWGTFFHGRLKEDGMAIYEAHNELCKQVIPADQLLVFNVKEGWGPLCAFLGKEVPEGDFPYENEGKQMAAMFNSMNRFLVLQLIGYTAGIAGLTAVLAFKRQNIAAFIRGFRT
ncbi:hypothetical protein AURDEDRAFT_116577 [Auricularia subglabra TFB-10046 SS5]|nr:hypothetical protein AURDEDRAFT_116577 [Auricularia subglabra TFB-10046 SS5]